MATYSASFPIPQNMLDTIDNCTLGLGAVGVVGGAVGPGADLAIIAPTWIGMTLALAEQAGAAMDEETAKKIVYAAATGIGSFALGSKIAATVAGWLFATPSAGISLAIAMGGNALLNGKLTHAYGKAVALYFLQTDNLSDSDVAIQVLVALVAIQLGFGTASPLVQR